MEAELHPAFQGRDEVLRALSYRSVLTEQGVVEFIGEGLGCQGDYYGLINYLYGFPEMKLSVILALRSGYPPEEFGCGKETIKSLPMREEPVDGEA